MNFFDFVTEDELEQLPYDNVDAFVKFVRIAQSRFDARLRELDEEQDWNLVQEANYHFMMVVNEAAQRHEIEPLASSHVPVFANFDVTLFRQFKADLTQQLAKLTLNRRGLLAPQALDRIRTTLNALKICLDGADLPERKKAALLKKLAEFEHELQKKRPNLTLIALILMEVVRAPGDIGASYNVVTGLVSGILTEITDASAADEARRLSSKEPLLGLPAPLEMIEHYQDNAPDDEGPF